MAGRSFEPAVYILLIGLRLAAAAAIVFTVTSIHTGAVFWISARTTLLSTFLLFASLVMDSSRAHRGLAPRVSIFLDGFIRP